MVRKMNWIIGLTLVSVIIGGATMVHAWEPDDILSHFQPYVTAQEEYSSNIDLEPNSIKRSDYITTIFPGFRFSTLPRSTVTGEFQAPPAEVQFSTLPRATVSGESGQTPAAEEKYYLDLDLKAGFNFYAKNQEENYTSLNGLLRGGYALTRRLNFRVRDYLIRSNDIREADYSATAIPNQYLISRTGRRNAYYRNVFEPSFEYRFGEENVLALNYRNNVYRINSDVLEDSMENFISPRIAYWFDVRNGVSLTYGLTLGDFQRSPDLVGHMGVGRYIYRFNPRTSIFAEYAQLWRDFDPPSIDYMAYRPSIGIEHAFSSTLTARVQGGYFWANPKEGSKIDAPFFDVLLTQRSQRTTYTLSLLGGYTEDIFTAENLGFTQYYRALASITHQVFQRMDVGVFGSYEWIKISGFIPARRPVDQIWAVGGNASYQILRWLTVSVQGSFRQNRSNIDIPDRDYSEYRGIFNITAAY